MLLPTIGRQIPVEFLKIILHQTNILVAWDFMKLKNVFCDFECSLDFELMKTYSINDPYFIYWIIHARGSLNLLKAVYELHLIDEIISTKICEWSAMAGRLDCLTWAHEEANYPWDEYTCYCATVSDHIECLVYAYTHGCPLDISNTIYGSMLNGSHHCLSYLEQMKPEAAPSALPITVPILCESCRQKQCLYHIDIPSSYQDYFHLPTRYRNKQALQHLWKSNLCDIAAASGHLSCLQYAHEMGYPWSHMTVRIAADSGHIVCLKYALDHGAPSPPEAESSIR